MLIFLKKTIKLSNYLNYQLKSILDTTFSYVKNKEN